MTPANFQQLANFINGLSENVRKIFEYFEFEKEIEKLDEANRLYLVVSKFAEIDAGLAEVEKRIMGMLREVTI